MTLQLSWDLHVHPGPSSVPRWGTGAEIQMAAKRAGLTGFVWKSHEDHTADACRRLPLGPPWAVGSASLNAWCTPDSLARALAEGARWVWGPTYNDGHVGWDLPLPPAWAAFADLLRASEAPLVLATGHLGAGGRRAFAEFARSRPAVQCSVTHSLYLPSQEVDDLRQLGAVFEVDLYTGTRLIADRPQVELAAGIAALRDMSTTVYLTTDAGQRDVGDPYVFSSSVLQALVGALGLSVVEEIAMATPERVAAHAMGGLP